MHFIINISITIPDQLFFVRFSNKAPASRLCPDNLQSWSFKVFRIFFFKNDAFSCFRIEPF